MSNVSMKGVVFASKSPCKSPLESTNNSSSSKINERLSNQIIFSVSQTIPLRHSNYQENPSRKISNNGLDTSTIEQQSYYPLKHSLTPTKSRGRIIENTNSNNNSSINYVNNILARSRSPYAGGQSSKVTKDISFIDGQNIPNYMVVSNNNNTQYDRIISKNNNILSANKNRVSSNQSNSFFGTPSTKSQQAYLQTVRNSQHNDIYDNQNYLKPNSRYNNQDFLQVNNGVELTRDKSQNNQNLSNFMKEQSIYNMILQDHGKSQEIISKRSSNHRSSLDRQQSGSSNPENDSGSNKSNNMNNNKPISRKVSDHLKNIQQQQNQQYQEQLVDKNNNQIDIQQQQNYQEQQKQSKYEEFQKNQDIQKQYLGKLSISNQNLNQYSNSQTDNKQTNNTSNSASLGNNNNTQIQKTAGAVPSSTCQNCVELDKKIEMLLQIINQCQKCSVIRDNSSLSNINGINKLSNQIPLNQSEQLNQINSTSMKESRELIELVTYLKRQLDAVRQERDLGLSKIEEYEYQFEIHNQEFNEIKRLNTNLYQKLKDYQQFIKKSFSKSNLLISRDLNYEVDYLKSFVNTVIDCDKRLRSNTLTGVIQDQHEQLENINMINYNYNNNQLNRSIERLQSIQPQNEQNSLVIPSAIKALDMVYRLKVAEKQARSDKSENPFIIGSSPIV